MSATTSINASVLMRGRYTLQKGSASKGPGREHSFDNLITDSGLDLFGRSDNIDVMATVLVGTSSAEPIFADTSLKSLRARTEALTPGVTRSLKVEEEADHFRYTVTKSFRFAAGAASGLLTEVGVGYLTGSTPLIFSRALIRDDLGQPMVLEVSADEYLDVKYSLTFLYPKADTFFSLNLNGVNHTGVMRPAGMTSRSAPELGLRLSTFLIDNLRSYKGSPAVQLGPVTGGITGTAIPGYGSGNPVLGAYVAGSFTRDVTVTAGVTQSNDPSGLGGCLLGSPALNQHQIVFTPPIPKTDQQILTLTFRFSWGRA